MRSDSASPALLVRDTRFAICSQIFTVIQAEAGDVPETARALALVDGSMRLGSVFDDAQPMLMREIHDRLHLRRVAVQMDGNDGARALAQSAIQLSPVHCVGIRLDIDKNGRRAHLRYSLDGGNKRMRDRNHLIAGSNMAGTQSQRDGIGSIRKANSIITAAIAGETLLESLILRTKKELHVIQHILDGRHYLQL